jgi:hypothetical protein
MKRENNFKWTSKVVKIIIGMSILFSIAFVILQFLDELWGGMIVCLLGVMLSYVAYLEIVKILDIKNLKELFQKLKMKK